MVKKTLIGLFVFVIMVGMIAWMNKKAIVLYLGANVGLNKNILPNQAVPWKEGPESEELPIGERPPNIVFILTDDLGINDISAFGGGVAGGKLQTPNIDRIAASGAIFDQAYSGSATSAPSRAMLMTGRYPTRTGFEFTPMPGQMGRVVTLFGNDMDTGLLADAHANGLPLIKHNRDIDAPPFDDQGLPGSEITIAEVLQKAGYHTVHIGKWHLGRTPESLPHAQGFDESLILASGLYLPQNHPEVVNAKIDFDPIDIFLWRRMQYAAAYNFGDWFEPAGYVTDYYTDEALNVIENNRNRPFFLYLAHWAPHTPLQATRQDYEAVGNIEPHRLRVYAAMVRALDRSVGRIIKKLEEEGLSENTIVVFSSDNGGPGYVGLLDLNLPYRGWKSSFFEGGIRVPKFIKWPARIEPGTYVDAPVSQIDIMPTLAAAAGADLPAGVVIDGMNLLPLVTGEDGFSRHNDALFWQSGPYKAVRAGDWKLQVDDIQDKVWLFDLKTDPSEQNNLAGSRPDKISELTSLLHDHHADARPPLFPHTVEVPVVIDKTLADKYERGDEYVIWPN